MADKTRREWETESGNLAVSIDPPKGETPESGFVTFSPHAECGGIATSVMTTNLRVIAEIRNVIAADAGSLGPVAEDLADELADFYGPHLPKSMMRALRENPK